MLIHSVHTWTLGREFFPKTCLEHHTGKLFPVSQVPVPGGEPVQEEHHEAGLHGRLWLVGTVHLNIQRWPNYKCRQNLPSSLPELCSHRCVRSERTRALDGSPALRAAQRSSLAGGEALQTCQMLFATKSFINNINFHHILATFSYTS